MTYLPSPSGDLKLGHIFAMGGIADFSDLLVIRHTYREDGITQASEATPAKLLTYTRGQKLSGFPRNPPRTWLTFFADGGRRSRFITAYENHGEIEAERTETLRSTALRTLSVPTRQACYRVVQRAAMAEHRGDDG